METLFHLVTFAFVFAFGASVGSFLNVVIYRFPLPAVRNVTIG